MVDINEVYNTVLTLANKESNSFVTPEEFNDIAQKAQSEIFESYFYEEGRSAVVASQVADDDYSDVGHNTREKLSLFDAQATLTVTEDNADFVVDQSNYYRFNRLFLPNYVREIEEVKFSELPSLLNSPYSCPNETKPVYLKVGGTASSPTEFRVFPQADFTTTDGVSSLTSGIDTILLHYTRSPRTPHWAGAFSTGQLIPVSSAVRNPDPSNANYYQDFELHESEFHNLVNKIARSIGIITRDIDLINYFSAQDQIVEQKEQ